MSQHYHFKLILPCFASIELIAQSALDQLHKQVGFSVDKLDQAKILITEGIINAVEYSSSSENEIEIGISYLGDALKLIVSDSGNGFAIPDVKQPDLEKKIASGNNRGWGLSIMKSLSDEFTLESNDHGTKICMYLRLND
jgi:anti-sigma regulatory factor (Ser/Thr protein kinase)